MTAVGQAIDLNLDFQLYYQLVHPLTTTVIAPMLVLVILNYFILARVAAGRLRRVSSRVTRYLFISTAQGQKYSVAFFIFAFLYRQYLKTPYCIVMF